MLLKPVVPLPPVRVNERVVDVADWFVAILTFDIWELVTFPLIVRLTVAPLSVVACTVVAVEFGVGDGVSVEVDGVVSELEFDVDVKANVAVME